MIDTRGAAHLGTGGALSVHGSSAAHVPHEFVVLVRLIHIVATLSYSLSGANPATEFVLVKTNLPYRQVTRHCDIDHFT